MAVTGRTGAPPPTAEGPSAETKALFNAVASLRKRLAMEQDQQVDAGDIETDDILRNTERAA